MSTVSEVNKLSGEADALREAYAAAKADYEKVKALCGQHGYSVTIAGVRVDVAAMDSKTYKAKMIRGREMIHLGALKALDGRVDAAWAALLAKCQQVADAASSLADAIKVNGRGGV